MTAEKSQPPHGRPSVSEYLMIGAIIATGVAMILTATSYSTSPAAVRELVFPMTAMFALTAVAWLLMTILRFGAVIFGVASVTYFKDYKTEPPAEWIERPARIFNNLMQVPMLFYVVTLMMLAAPWVDRPQVILAWIYVAFRVLHAIIYMGFNYVPFRFATYAASCITLVVMWARFALAF
jgi:hypothetical protein